MVSGSPGRVADRRLPGDVREGRAGARADRELGPDQDVRHRRSARRLPADSPRAIKRPKACWAPRRRPRPTQRPRDSMRSSRATAPSGVKRGTFDVNAFDAVIVAFLAALKAGTADSHRLEGQPRGRLWARRDAIRVPRSGAGDQGRHRRRRTSTTRELRDRSTSTRMAIRRVCTTSGRSRTGRSWFWRRRCRRSRVRTVGRPQPADGFVRRPRPPRYSSTTFSSWRSSCPTPSYRFCPMSRT